MKRRTEDEVVLRDFAVADLLRERVLAVVHIDIEPELAELLCDLGRIFPLYATSAMCLVVIDTKYAYVWNGDGDDQNLAGRQPEWPV